MNYEAIVVIATLIIALTHIIWQQIQIKKLKNKIKQQNEILDTAEGYIGICEEEIQKKDEIINERQPPADGVPMMIAMAEVVG
jgi:peptidoglycan hydrolase CwlO-like protein